MLNFTVIEVIIYTSMETEKGELPFVPDKPDNALGVVFLASKVNDLSDAIICPTHCSL